LELPEASRPGSPPRSAFATRLKALARSPPGGRQKNACDAAASTPLRCVEPPASHGVIESSIPVI
jgi:hypothetical protein